MSRERRRLPDALPPVGHSSSGMIAKRTVHRVLPAEESSLISRTGVRGSAPVGVIRNICGTIFAVSTGNSGVSQGQRTNSLTRNGGLRSRERARRVPDRAVNFAHKRSLAHHSRAH
jgi:hypothetical protein